MLGTNLVAMSFHPLDLIRKLSVNLQQRPAEIEVILDVLPIGIAIADDPWCRGTRVNRALARLLGIEGSGHGSLSEPAFGPLPVKARPNKTTYTKDALSFAGQDIEYGYLLQAHTDGDLYVHFKQANVLVAGGVVSADGWPLLDWETGGWIAGLVAGYDKLLKVADANTKIVPANGAVLSRGDIEGHRKMYMTIYERLVAGLNKGLGSY